MLDWIAWELANRVFPWVFTHRKPIRSRHLGSRDPCAGFQSSDARASQNGVDAEVFPPLEEWHIDLEVGSQVYQLLKGFKQLQKATPWPDTMSSLYM